tara:strand:+ start:1298 stop:1462 length:165 start_codon:yes stop_codon:yes gene_type:complete
MHINYDRYEDKNKIREAIAYHEWRKKLQRLGFGIEPGWWEETDDETEERFYDAM